MRIGLFTNNYRPLINGLTTSVDTFAGAFRRAGHAVTIVAPRYGAGGTDDGDVLRVPGLRAPTHHAYVLPFPRWPGLRQAVLARDLDVYHAQHPYLLGAAAARWARETGRPLLFTYHTRYDRYAHYIPGPARLIARLAVRRALRFAARADLVVAPSPSVARDLSSQGLRTPVEVIPTGVPLPPPTTEDARQAQRAALGLGAGGPLFLSMGRLAREKNQAFLLHAFCRLLRELPAARLVLVGDGDDRARLTRLADDLGIRPSICFVGAVSHERIGDYTSAADLFLFPSTSETQGLAALEAMAAGLPVVAVASEAARDLLAGEPAGVLCPEDPDAFAGSVLALWAAPERRLAMAEAARRVAARCAPEAGAAKLLGLYQELCHVRRPASERANSLPPREIRT
jgi:glycosyltransferase involved in cell wall biosynthesis